MFAIPGIVLLLVQDYLRPQEFIVALQSAPLLYLFFALALFGLAVDLKLRLSQLVAPPQLAWAIAYIGWALVTVTIRLPGQAQTAAMELAIPFTFFFLLSIGVQSFRAFSTVAATILAIALALSAVGTHQGFSPFGCFKLESERDATGIYDGRSCASPRECNDNDAEEGADYACEHVGLFGTSSVGFGRVRYRGALNDPNELSLALGVALPFAFAFYERKRSTRRLLLLLLSLALVGTCVYLTRSRGGQLVFATVLAVYCWRRFGVGGLVIGGAFAAALLAVAAGHRADADESSLERIEMMHLALDLLRQYPLRGVGYGRILDYNPLTAHNSYALAGAESGFLGLYLFTALLFISFKTVVTIFRRYQDDARAAVARTWALALLASLSGMTIGIFFLSFCYHDVFWINIALTGALYQACRAHDPELRVSLDRHDLFRLFFIDIALVVVLYGYTTLKLRAA